MGVLEGSLAVALAIQHLNTGDGSVIPQVEGLNDNCNIRFTLELFDSEMSECNGKFSSHVPFCISYLAFNTVQYQQVLNSMINPNMDYLGVILLLMTVLLFLQSCSLKMYLRLIIWQLSSKLLVVVHIMCSLCGRYSCPVICAYQIFIFAQ